MKKTLAIILCVVLACSALACLAACNKKDEITIWVSETEGVTDLTEEQIKRYIAANSDAYDWDSVSIKVEGVTEGDSASSMIADVENGPDIYCFAQDQLARLVEAGALTEITGTTADEVKANNDAGSVSAASVAGKLYCFPITSDNGYFMYYDKSVIDEEDIDDLAAIVADCEANDKLFSFALENAWYTASFFFATGCHSNWTTDEDGKFTSVDDTWNSANGIIAMRGMQILTKSTCWNSASEAAAFNSGAAVVISGTWDSSTAQEALGENYGVADLPSFTIDGKSYHLGSYSGNKLMGVKPQTDSARATALIGLANYLAGEECQLERFDSKGWGPSNKNAQENDAVKSNPALVALAQQSEYATPQGQIHGSWWDYAKVLGTASKNAAQDDVAALQAALNTYTENNTRVLSMSEEELNAWTVIGTVGGTSWDTDLTMSKIESTDTTETWKTNDAYDIAADGEFKIRQGKSWSAAYGSNEQNADTTIGLGSKANFVIADEGYEAGRYYIQIVIDTSANTAVISLIAAE